MRRVLLGAIALATLAGPVLGDGFHNPLLRNKEPRRWAETVRENLGLDRTDSAAEPTSPGGGFAKRAAAGQLLEVLKYLDRKNVLLREFPDFNYDKIPEFKTETEAILIAIGKDAVPLLTQTLVTDLTGAAQQQGDLKRAADFRDRLVHILVAIGEDSLGWVVALLDHGNAKVRVTFLRIAQEIVIDPDFGKKAELWQRWWGIRKAGNERTASAVPRLIAALEDDDRRIRAEAVRSLGLIRSRKAVPALLAALKDKPSPTEINALVRALARIGDRTATPELIRLLGDGREAVREEAATALRFLTREMKGFEPRGKPEDRAKAIARWQDWWETIGNK